MKTIFLDFCMYALELEILKYVGFCIGGGRVHRVYRDQVNMIKFSPEVNV